MVADIPPGNMHLHLCLRAPTGLVVVDTCPSRAAFEAFAEGSSRRLREQHGLPDPKQVDGFPVHAAFVHGERVEARAAA